MKIIPDTWIIRSKNSPKKRRILAKGKVRLGKGKQNFKIILNPSAPDNKKFSERFEERIRGVL